MEDSIRGKRLVLNNASEFYPCREMIINGFGNKVFPFTK